MSPGSLFELQIGARLTSRARYATSRPDWCRTSPVLETALLTIFWTRSTPASTRRALSFVGIVIGRRQHLEIDQVGHCLISGILRMEMIAGVECRQDVRRTVRVACRCVEVDHAIESAAATDPLVDGLALLLLSAL